MPLVREHVYKDIREPTYAIVAITSGRDCGCCISRLGIEDNAPNGAAVVIDVRRGTFCPNADDVAAPKRLIGGGALKEDVPNNDAVALTGAVGCGAVCIGFGAPAGAAIHIENIYKYQIERVY